MTSSINSMKKKIAFITLLLVIVPSIALAYSTPTLWPTGFWGPLVSCTGNPYIINSNSGTTPTTNPNACQNLCDLVNTFINIIYFAISIAFFIIAPILFLVGGIMVMVAGANPEMLSKGKSTLKATAIGVLIVLCSYLIVLTAVQALNISGVGGFSSNSPSCTSSATS